LTPERGLGYDANFAFRQVAAFQRISGNRKTMERVPTVSGTTNLIDILDRVLDKGLVIAGDIRVSLANVELLTIRIRLLVCSVDKAEQIGLNWWKYDPHLTAQSSVVPTAALPPTRRLAAPNVAPRRRPAKRGR
jgi:hypothetical protein